jgi:IS605 OrfB family transposase
MRPFIRDRSLPSNEKRHVFTYQTRVFVTTEQDKMLREYAVRFGRVERTLYRDLQKGKDANRLKSAYLVCFAITARQFNAVRIQLQGKIEAIRQQLPVQVTNLQSRICKAKKIVARLRKRRPGSNQLHQKRRRLAGLELRFEQLEAERKAGQIHLCFGSKKLFRSQFHLAANGFRSHAEWKQAWTEARSSQFFVLGSKDETAGCQGCVATRNLDGSYDLRVRLPNAATEKHLVISGVRFPYGREQFEQSLAVGRALSYRFLRDAKGWRVFVSSEGSPGKRISDRRLGAIGIDINVAQLVLAEVDRFGNFIGGERISCVSYGKRKAQAKAIMGDAVKRVMAGAIRGRKPIVIERLEFAEKKSSLENEESGRARMLSSFAYRQIVQYLKAAAFRAGVEVIEVNPAYTSTIGAVNYAARFGISIHQGAAIAIARRGLDLSERPAVRVAQLPTRGGGHVTLPLPEWTRGRQVWSLWSQVSRRIRAVLRAPVQLLPATLGSIPVSLYLQTPCATCTVHGATPARQSFPTLFGKRCGIKCHI